MAAEIFCSPLLLSSSLLRCMTLLLLLTMYSFRLLYQKQRVETLIPTCAFPFFCPLIVLFGWHAWTRLHLCVLVRLLVVLDGAGSLGDVRGVCVPLSHTHTFCLSLSPFFFLPPLSASESLKWMVAAKGFWGGDGRQTGGVT